MCSFNIPMGIRKSNLAPSRVRFQPPKFSLRHQVPSIVAERQATRPNDPQTASTLFCLLSRMTLWHGCQGKGGTGAASGDNVWQSTLTLQTRNRQN